MILGEKPNMQRASKKIALVTAANTRKAVKRGVFFLAGSVGLSASAAATK